jgi:hypothetical protein
VQQTVADLAKTAIDYPPMQAPATFNLDAVKKEIEEKIKQHEGEWLADASERLEVGRSHRTYGPADAGSAALPSRH